MTTVRGEVGGPRTRRRMGPMRRRGGLLREALQLLLLGLAGGPIEDVPGARLEAGEHGALLGGARPDDLGDAARGGAQTEVQARIVGPEERLLAGPRAGRSPARWRRRGWRAPRASRLPPGWRRVSLIQVCPSVGFEVLRSRLGGSFMFWTRMSTRPSLL